MMYVIDITGCICNTLYFCIKVLLRPKDYQGVIMKKRYIFLIIITLLIGLPLLRFWGMKQEINQEMQYTARSVRAKELMEEVIKEQDPKAFTDEGIIKSYEIDYDTVKHNSIGGFSILTYVNNDKELYFRFLFDKHHGLGIGTYSMSSKLDDILREAYYTE